MSLKKKVITGVKLTTNEMVVVSSLNFIKNIILARLVEPSDFGLISISTVFIGVAQLFMDLGVGNAIIQKKDTTIRQLSTLYWMNIALGFICFFVLSLLSPVIANVYDEKELSTVILLVSLTFLISPWGNQFSNLMKKSMMFGILFRINLMASVISFVFAVYTAYIGWGVYALILSSVLRVFSNTVFNIFYGLKHFEKPKLIFKLNEVKDHLRFGLFRLGDMLTNKIGSNLDVLIIGKMLNVEVLGYYQLASHLIRIPVSKINPILTKVTFPLFSRIQDNDKQINKYFRNAFNLLALINIPILVGLGLTSKEVITVVYGIKWLPAADIVTILAFVGINQSLGNIGGSVILAKGRSDIGFYWNFVRAFILAGFIYISIRINPSLTGVGYGLLLANI